VLNEQAPVSVVGRTAGLLRGVYDLTDLIELINSTQMLSTIAKSYATLVILEQWSDGIKNISKSIDALRDATKLFPVGCEMLAR
jgi:alpha-glucuronidase